MTCVQRPQLPQRARPVRTTARWVRELGLATALIVIMVAPPGAQTRAVVGPSAGVMAAVHQQIDLLVGRSMVLTTDRPIQRVSLSTPDIADALVTSPREILIHGKTPGTISLLVWSDTGRIATHDVVVRRDLVALEEHLAQLFPGEAITVAANGSDIVLAGTVSNEYVVDKAAAVAAGHVETPENVVNLLRQQEGVASEQIMLRVRFAEVSRTALQEVGASFFTDILGHDDFIGRLTTQQFAAPNFSDPNSQQFERAAGDGGLVFSDFLNILAFSKPESIGVAIKALETRGLLQSLAEPNLITQNGTEAMFLAGGEYPYPVVQGVSGAVTIVFKEFGVRLRFTPTIVSPGRIHLKVAPEVSALDFSNSISIAGFRVPTLSTRKTETEVELRDGQTFAIAGLIDNSVTETMSKIPGLGDIPILGLLFKSRAYQKSQTELVVMITPQIISSGSPGVSPRLPDLVTPFLAPPDQTLPSPPASQLGANRTGVTPAGAAAARAPDEVHPFSSEPAPAVVAAHAPGASGPATAIRTPLDPRAERTRLEAERRDAANARDADAKLAREAAKRAVEEATRAATAEEKRLDVERKQAEKTRKADEKLARAEAKRAAEEATRAAKAEEKRARAEAKLAREAAKRAAEEATRAAKAERKRLDAERKQAEKTRKAEEKVARAEAKRAAEEATRAAEQAARAAKAERKRLDAERKQADKNRKEEEKRALAQAVADAQRYEREWTQAEKERERLAKEHAKRQAELDRVRAEFQEKLGRAQRAVDEIDRERQRLEDGTPEPEADSGRG